MGWRYLETVIGVVQETRHEHLVLCHASVGYLDPAARMGLNGFESNLESSNPQIEPSDIWG